MPRRRLSIRRSCSSPNRSGSVLVSASAIKLARSGLAVPEENLWTSAMATATFLVNQSGEKTAFVMGEVGLTTALHGAGFVLTDVDPEYVVLGETRALTFDQVTRAIRLINAGARFIITNPDTSGPDATGVVPATGAFAAMITAATGRKPYVIGKPNPIMFRTALNRISAHSESTGMIGDTMGTDIVAGMEAGLTTVLVLTGSTRAADIREFPYRPSVVLDSVADLIPLLAGSRPSAAGNAPPPAAPRATTLEP